MADECNARSIKYTQYKDVIPAFGVPALNTALLLIKWRNCTFAHWALKKVTGKALCSWLAATVLLGFIFVGFQAMNIHAIKDLDLTLNGGIYGSTFYYADRVSWFHVTMGAVMLAVIYFESKGHFS